MNVRGPIRLLVGVALLLGGVRSAHALPIVLPRPGQIGFSIQGQYGDLLKSGNLGGPFGSGGGLAVRLRYRMRYERALGLSFESQSFDARTTVVVDTTRTIMKMLLSGVDLYQMFNTDQRLQAMVSVGAGIAQIHFVDRDHTVEYPLEGDGLYAGAGFGVERFVYRSLALDLSGRYTAVFEGGKVNHEFQGAAGVIFYASY